MEKAIEDDVIVWHANALNNFNELLDTELLEYSLQVGRNGRSTGDFDSDFFPRSILDASTP